MKLPLPDELFGMKGIDFNRDLDYQTKNLGQSMRQYEITKNGVLLRLVENFNSQSDEWIPYPIDDGEISMLEVHFLDEGNKSYKYIIRYTLNFKNQKVNRILLTEFKREEDHSAARMDAFLKENSPSLYHRFISYIFSNWRQLWGKVPSTYTVEAFFKGTL